MIPGLLPAVVFVALAAPALALMSGALDSARALRAIAAGGRTVRRLLARAAGRTTGRTALNRPAWAVSSVYRMATLPKPTPRPRYRARRVLVGSAVALAFLAGLGVALAAAVLLGGVRLDALRWIVAAIGGAVALAAVQALTCLAFLRAGTVAHPEARRLRPRPARRTLTTRRPEAAERPRAEQ